MSKSSKNAVIGIVIVVVIALIAWLGFRGSGDQSASNVPQNPLGEVTGTSTTPLPVSETTKSGSLSKYQNAELGFSLQYPSSWEKGDMANGVQLVMPIDQTQVSTVNRLEADITVDSGKCAFPPVTTVDQRGTIQLAGMTANMISMSNSVQGRSYFNRMYSLQKGSICYFFSFTYVALSPESKGFTGSNLTQAKNNNNAIKTTADAAFTNMVKTFQFVTLPTGEDETQAAPAK